MSTYESFIGFIRAAGKVLTISNSGTLAGGDGYTLAIAALKTLTVSNTTTLAGGDGNTLAIAASKTLTVSNSTTIAGGDGNTLAIAASKTLTVSNTLTLAGTDSTTMTFPAESASIGFRGVPAQSQSADYTAVLGDAGKSIDHPSTDANARTFTIPANASVAYEIGTTLTFTNMTANVVTIAITSDTLYLAGTGSTGSRSLAQYGVATARKLTSTTWIIAGSGLT